MTKEEAIKRIRDWNLDKDKMEVLSVVIPELAESEDERIRKGIIQYLEQSQFGEEHYHIDDDIVRGYIVWLEKQGKQKPIDEVKSKLKVGDWITFCGSEPFKILEVEPEQNGILNYLLLEPSGCSTYYDKKYVDENARLWTIQDAKDGDVLVDNYGNMLLYEEISSPTFYHSYCFGNENVFIENGGAHMIECTHPATKEQRDFLFSKMKEEGYEWDAEKKELRKIEQKPVWNEEDEEMFDAIIADIQFTQKAHNHEVNQVVYEREIDWFKSLKDRMVPQNTWKPTEEQMKALSDAAFEFEYAQRFKDADKIQSLYNDLKKL